MLRTHASLIIAVVLFVGLSSTQLWLPGLHYDEAVELVPAMQLLADQPVTTFRGNGIWLGDHLVPLMTQDYIGALNTYLALAVFPALGVSVVSVRLIGVAVGVVTLVLAHSLARQLAGGVAGDLAALLLAVSPTFVFWSRQGVFVTSVTAAIGLAAASAWLAWWRRRRARYAVAGACLMGLGIYAKLLFLWLILGLAVAAGVVSLAQSRGNLRAAWARVRQEGGWQTATACGLAFVAGCLPLLAYNLQTGGTLDSLGSNLTTSYYGTDNLAFLPNLGARLEQFVAVLSGAHLWYLGAQYANWLSVAVFTVGLVAALWIGARCGGGRASRLVPVLVIGSVIVASCATVSALWVTHFAILMPWPALAVGCAIGGLFDRSSLVATRRLSGPGVRRGLTIAALALVAAAWVGDAVTDVRYHQALAVSGGLGAHSDAVYDLADWLAAVRAQREEVDGTPLHVAAMDWGISAPVTLLTRGAVTPAELFGYAWESDAALTARLTQFIGYPDAVYLWRAPDEIVFDRSGPFKALYAARGLEEDILAAFYERSGRPVLGATRLVPAGTATNPPQPLPSR
jgi:4-amino-4-deoxy-L-arabinose transferase-like glycosyltransferase